MSNRHDGGGSRFTGGLVVPFGCPGYLGGEQKPFQTLKECHLQWTFSTAAVVTRPGGMCFLDRIKSSVKLSARKKNKSFFYHFKSSSAERRSRPAESDDHGACTWHFGCCDLLRQLTLACTDGRSNTHKHSASGKPRTTSPPHHPRAPLRALEVLPVFKSSLRPLSVDKSNGWLGTAAGQPRADESLGIMVSLCQEFLARQDLFCSVQATGLQNAWKWISRFFPRKGLFKQQIRGGVAFS